MQKSTRKRGRHTQKKEYRELGRHIKQNMHINFVADVVVVGLAAHFSPTYFRNQSTSVAERERERERRCKKKKCCSEELSQ